MSEVAGARAVERKHPSYSCSVCGGPLDDCPDCREPSACLYHGCWHKLSGFCASSG